MSKYIIDKDYNNTDTECDLIDITDIINIIYIRQQHDIIICTKKQLKELYEIMGKIINNEE